MRHAHGLHRVGHLIYISCWTKYSYCISFYHQIANVVSGLAVYFTHYYYVVITQELGCTYRIQLSYRVIVIYSSTHEN